MMGFNGLVSTALLFSSMVFGGVASAGEALLPQYVTDSSQLRSYILPLTSKDQRFSIALIGVDRSDVLGTSLAKSFYVTSQEDFKITDARFQNFEPMFLLFLSERGIHDVYSFNVGRFDTSTFGIMPKMRGTWIEEQKTHPERFPGLPVRFFDVQHIGRSKLADQAQALFWELLTLTPASVLAKPARLDRAERDNQMRTNLKLLENFIADQIIPGRSELSKYVTFDQLAQLQAATEARVGRQSTVADLFFGTAKKRLEKARTFNKEMALASIQKMELVAKEAAREGLLIIPFGSNAGIVAVDVSKGTLPTHVFHLVSKARIQEAIRKYQNHQGGPIVGISTFVAPEQAFTDGPEDWKIIYRESLDLEHTHAQIDKELSLHTFKLLRALGYSLMGGFVTLGMAYGEVGLGLAADFTETAIGYVAEKYQSDLGQALKKIFSYTFADMSELQIAAETGILVPAPGDEGKFFSGILGYIKSELPRAEYEKLLAEFHSRDSQTVAHASKALMLRYLGSVENSQYMFERTTLAQRLQAKEIYVKRLANWLEDKQWRVYCGSYASCREGKAVQLAHQIEKDVRKERNSASKP